MKRYLLLLLLSFLFWDVQSAENCYKNRTIEQYTCGSRVYNKPKTEKRRICFFTDWANVGSRKETGIDFDWDKVDPFLCSHINYCFMTVGYQDNAWKLQNRTTKVKTLKFLENLRELKKVNPKLKIIISVGGATHDKKSDRFHTMLEFDWRRDEFIKSVVEFMKKQQLDGLSLDWEYPNYKPEIREEDNQKKERQKFTDLLRNLREEFDKVNINWTLSASVSAGAHFNKKDKTTKIDRAYDVPAMEKYLDWVNVMAYALWTQSNSVKKQKVTGHFTAMKVSDKYMNDYPKKTVQAAIAKWIELGMPREKINLGTATYGKSFKLSDPLDYGLGAKTEGSGDKGPLLNKVGTRSYLELCDEKWDHMVDYDKSEVKAPYASKGKLWVAYETPESMEYKVDQVVNKFDYSPLKQKKKNTNKKKDATKNQNEKNTKGVGGISFWTLGLDDFKGECSKSKEKLGTFPIIRAAVERMD